MKRFSLTLIITFCALTTGVCQDVATPRSFFEQHCFDCHSGADSAGGQDLTTLSGEIADADQVHRWLIVLDQLQTDLMPPPSEESPDRLDRIQAIQWIENRVLRSDHAEAYRRKLQLPSYGNYVDHELLFGGTIKAKAYSPSRLWRVSPQIFSTLRGVGKVKGLQNPYGFSTPESGIRDYASTSDVGSSVVETIMLNANAEIEYQIQQAERVIKDPPKRRSRPNPFVPFLVPDAEPNQEQIESIVEGTFTRLVSRPPTESERSKYVDFLKQNIAETGDPRRSMKATLTAIYLSPEAIYRMEWGLGDTDDHGRRMLSPEEIAYALSYALFDHGPLQGGRAENQKVIGNALREGRLNSSEDVARVVSDVLATETYRPIGGKAKDNVPRVMRFFREFFGYHRAVDVFKDNRRVNEHGLYHDPRRLVRDADNLIKVILRDDQHVFERLLTTNEVLVFHDGDNQRLVDRHKALVADLEAYDEDQARREIDRRKAGVLKKPKYKANPDLVPAALRRIENDGKTLVAGKKSQLAKLLRDGVSLGSVRFRDYKYIRAYNLDTRTWKWPAEQPFELPADQRAGILTHPAWLAAHSLNDGNDPVHRGIWVYEKLLAGVLGDVPPSVDARVPEDPHRTLRERMDVLRADACWKCHRKINPLGEAFEIYDDFGRYRSQHYFDENQRLITRRANHVLNAEGKEVLQAIDREERVAAGVYTARPVDASGSFDEVGIAEIHGEFQDAVEMMDRIAKADRVRQSIIRHMFRYFLGRNEMLSDSETLINADRAYRESNGSFSAVVVSLLSSDSFLYRR